MLNRDVLTHIARAAHPARAWSWRRVSRLWREAIELVWPQGLISYLCAIRASRAALLREVIDWRTEDLRYRGRVEYQRGQMIVKYIFISNQLSNTVRDRATREYYAHHKYGGGMRLVRGPLIHENYQHPEDNIWPLTVIKREHLY